MIKKISRPYVLNKHTALLCAKYLDQANLLEPELLSHNTLSATALAFRSISHHD